MRLHRKASTSLRRTYSKYLLCYAVWFRVKLNKNVRKRVPTPRPLTVTMIIKSWFTNRICCHCSQKLLLINSANFSRTEGSFTRAILEVAVVTLVYDTPVSKYQWYTSKYTSDSLRIKIFAYDSLQFVLHALVSQTYTPRCQSLV